MALVEDEYEFQCDECDGDGSVQVLQGARRSYRYARPPLGDVRRLPRPGKGVGGRAGRGREDPVRADADPYTCRRVRSVV